MAEIEQPMPPWGPRYDPLHVVCKGMGEAEHVIDYRPCFMLDDGRLCEMEGGRCGGSPAEPEEWWMACKHCGHCPED